ncbi:MAG TPA: glycerate kinase, partial [Bacteroidetes bacterium]|nr:glycerate kinase [Bacteroidota bacterium]
YIGVDVSRLPGGGAAGGIAAGAVAFLNAKIESGVQMVMEATGFFDKINKVDMVITGEGKMDRQTVEGKVVKGIADVSRKKNIPVAVLCGMVAGDKEIWRKMGIVHCLPLVREGVPVDKAMAQAAVLLEQRAFELAARIFQPEK